MDFILIPPKSPVLFQIFDLKIRYYGLLMAISIFCGLFLAYFLIKKRYSINEAEKFIDDAPVVIVFSIIGARIFYVLGGIDYYIKNPSEIIMLNHGGLSIWGAILFGIAAIIFFFRKYKLDIYKYLDIFALCMPLCQAIGRWGNFFNQEAYGKPLSSGIKLFVDYRYRYLDYTNVEYYHPAFLYESILNLISFLVLIFIFLKFKNIKDGTVFYLYLILYSLIRIIVESVRIDSILYVDSIPVAQIISFVIFIFAFFMLIKRAKSS